MRAKDSHQFLLIMSQSCYYYTSPHVGKGGISSPILFLAPYEYRTHFYRLQNGCIAFMLTGLYNRSIITLFIRFTSNYKANFLHTSRKMVIFCKDYP